MKNKTTLAEFKKTVQGSWSPDELYEMLRVDIREQVDRYFTELIRTELKVSWDENAMNDIESHLTNVTTPMRQHHPQRDWMGSGKVLRNRLGTYLTWFLWPRVLERHYGRPKPDVL